MHSINRRTILRLGASGLATGAVAGLATPAAFARSFEDELWHYCPPPEKKILLLFLRGGNDGTNTLYPYGDPSYGDVRKELEIDPPSPGDLAGAIGSDFCGVHPDLASALEVELLTEMAFIQRVGYTNSSRSHFDGQQIWETADPSTTGSSLQNDGFLGRYIQEIAKVQNSLPAASFESAPPQSLFLSDRSLPQISNLGEYDVSDVERRARLLSVYGNAANNEVVRDGRILLNSIEDIRAVSGSYPPANGSIFYPTNAFGDHCREAAFVLGHTDCRVATLSLGDYFDTHSNQAVRHPIGLSLLGKGLRGIRQDAMASGLWNKLTVVVMSEFGRNVTNGNGGTDHGNAGVMMIAGGDVTPGAFNCDADTWFEGGQSPFNSDGSLTYRTDFRTVLSEVFTHIGLGNALGDILPGWPLAGDPNQPAAYTPLGLFG